MKLPNTPGEVYSKVRIAKKSLTFRWAIWSIVIIANIILAYLLFKSPPPPPVCGVNLNGIVKVQTSEGIGTGFLVTENYVLTAAHVAGDINTPVSILFEDGEQIEGNVIASGYLQYQQTVNSPEATLNDWAVIELSSSRSIDETIPLGDSDILEISEEVCVVGYPGGGPQNTSKGIISGIDDNAIRTDAPADPGYSGGPVISINQAAAVGILVSSPIIEGEVSQSVRNVVPINHVIDVCVESGIPIQ